VCKASADVSFTSSEAIEIRHAITLESLKTSVVVSSGTSVDTQNRQLIDS
jgi:hypothetical protein